MGVVADKFIMELLSSAPKLSGIDANIILYDLYETNYGIFHHPGTTKQRPLASVAMHETEDNTITSSMYEAIDSFHQKGIKDLFGLNLIEYLNLPTDICIKLMDSANKAAVHNSNLLVNLGKEPINRQKK